MYILRCMGSKFYVKFARVPVKYDTIFWTHILQNMHFTDLYLCVIYDIFELWRHKP